MKANGAPERIWIDTATDLPKLSGHIDNESIEYTRTDAFIEKAALWLEDNMRKWFKNINTHGLRMTGLMVDEFKKAML